MTLNLAYIADDFTGATDVLEVLTRAGVPAELFFKPPTAHQLEARPNLQAIGLATRCRSLQPAEMWAELRPLLTAVAALQPRHLHYKVCSTFDSSPTLGSIGAAIDLACEVLRLKGPVPVLAAAPHLGRWCVFGNLFARYGIGSAGEIYRLDLHPAMMNHPATPMDESDLRRHLAKQTDRPIHLLSILDLEDPHRDSLATLRSLPAESPIILCDALSTAHLATLGGIFESLAKTQAMLFTVGSSGVECALTAARGLAPRELPQASPATGPVLVVNGSCSPVTTEQIRHAELSGAYEVVRFSPPDLGATALATLAQTITPRLRLSANVLVTSTPAPHPLPPATLGAFLGDLVRNCIEQSGVRRVCFAGGDTSSYAAERLRLESLEVRAALTPGAPLCVAKAPGSALDGVELVFKGGQVGPPEFFTALR